MSFVIEYLSALRWQDYIDILILTIVIYQLLQMLQGTRTIQILIGFLFLGGLYYASGFFGLAGLSWVLTNLFNSLVLVVIVLFQADFRNALAQVGTKTFFRDFKIGRSQDLVEKLFTTCEHFSKSGVGALIVLEKDIGLGNYTNNAIKLDAAFSPQLMVTLFNTHAPLHDGAVIIDRTKRISHAGVILPLSASIDLSDQFGTRHRAALGLSEESDAVILVVSEETGRISIAHNGELIHYFETQKIKSKLSELLVVKSA